jgi:hypothetical protein
MQREMCTDAAAAPDAGAAPDTVKNIAASI